MAYDMEAGERRYQDEINEAAALAKTLFEATGVESIPVTTRGVDDLEGVAAAVKDVVIAARLNKGYELSYSQICNGIYRAAQELDIAEDPRNLLGR